MIYPARALPPLKKLRGGMEMEYVLNQLVNGLCQGAIYALMAIGYSVIVGVVGMVTFTYGEIMMIGASPPIIFFYCLATIFRWRSWRHLPDHF